MGQREDHVDIGGGQKVLAARCEPAVARVGLALWAMPVATRVEGDGALSATRAFIYVPAERGGSAAQDSGEHLLMQPGEPFPAALKERFSRGADHIGHLHGRSRHLLVVGRFRVGGVDRQRGQRTNRGPDAASGGIEADYSLTPV